MITIRRGWVYPFRWQGFYSVLIAVSLVAAAISATGIGGGQDGTKGAVEGGMAVFWIGLSLRIGSLSARSFGLYTWLTLLGGVVVGIALCLFLGQTLGFVVICIGMLAAAMVCENQRPTQTGHMP